MMAARIAHWCPGYGDPWQLTFGHWKRILEVIPDILVEHSVMLSSSVNEGTSGEVNHMRKALQVSRGNKRRERRLQNITGHRR